ncbi:rhodanese-like domain-containing protein, partial [Streptomyces sp. NPDC006743]
MFLSRHGPGRSGPERTHLHLTDGAAVLPHVRRAPEHRADPVPAAVDLPLSRPLTRPIDSSGAGAP